MIDYSLEKKHKIYFILYWYRCLILEYAEIDGYMEARSNNPENAVSIVRLYQRMKKSN